MTQATRTLIIVPSQSLRLAVDGDWTAEQIKSMYSTDITGLSAMAGTDGGISTVEGQATRTLTFNQPVGNKG